MRGGVRNPGIEDRREYIASQGAEEAWIQQIARRKAEQLQAEIRQDLEAANAYMAKHGSFAELVRQHDRNSDEG
jgi:hypothetical protein